MAAKGLQPVRTKADISHAIDRITGSLAFVHEYHPADENDPCNWMTVLTYEDAHYIAELLEPLLAQLAPVRITICATAAEIAIRHRLYRGRCRCTSSTDLL